MRRFLILFLLLSWPAWGIEIVCKVGDKRPPSDPLHLYDWRDGQIVNIRPAGFYLNPDGSPKSEMICKHFCVIELPHINYWTLTGAANWEGLRTPTSQWLAVKAYTSRKFAGKYAWEDGATEPGENDHARVRDWFVDFVALRDAGYITQDTLNSIYDKDRNHARIILPSTLTIGGVLKHEDQRVAYSDAERGCEMAYGTVSSGTYTVGTSQTYPDWSDAIADIAATLTGDLTFQGNTTEQITESTNMTISQNTASYTLTLTVHDDHVHNGGAYGSGHRVLFGTYDRFTVDDAGTNTTNNVIIEKLAINASGDANYPVNLSDGGDSGHLIVDRCVFLGNSASYSGVMLNYYAANCIVRNCSIYGFSHASDTYYQGNGVAIYDEYNSYTYEVYNNTVNGCTNGISNKCASPTGTVIVKNNLCVGNSADFEDDNSGFDTTATNVSGDASSPDGETYQNWAGTANMWDYDHNDFRLDNPDSTLILGSDLSAIGSPEQFSYDICGGTRDDWYIGAAEYLPTYQFARPSSTVDAGGWAGSVLSCHEDSDEATANGDVDYAIGESTDTTLKLGLSSVTDPETADGHIVRINACVYAGAGAGEKMDAYLYEGDTLRATLLSNQQPSDHPTYTSYVYTLTSGEANAITDYSALRVWIVVDTLGSGETFRVTQVEMQVPLAEEEEPPSFVPQVIWFY